MGAGSSHTGAMGLARPLLPTSRHGGLWLPGLLATNGASVSTCFVSLALCSLAGPRFPGLEMDQWAAHVLC